MAAHSKEAGLLFASLEAHGLLLLQDRVLPNVVTAIAGAPVAGSWWSHPAKQQIFHVLNELAGDADVLIAPLVNKKRTFIHRAYWPALIAIGCARESWQLRALAPNALALLRRIESEETVSASGDAAKQLELALLVASEEVHTDAGKHVKQLTTWASLARARRVTPSELGVPQAKAQLEAAARGLPGAADVRLKLPWQ